MQNNDPLSSSIQTHSDGDILTLFENDPKRLLSVSPKDVDRLRIVELASSWRETPERMRSLVLCRSALAPHSHKERPSERSGLSDEQMLLLTSIWDSISSRGFETAESAGLSSLLNVCFLLDRLILSADILSQLKTRPNIVDHLQRRILRPDNDRKYVYHILRTIRDPEHSPAWQTFFLIYDTLVEKQSHLILPVLDLFDKTRHLPDNWSDTLLAHALSCRNSLVVRRALTIALGSRATGSGPASSAVPVAVFTLHGRILQAFNTTAWFDANDMGSTNVFSGLQTFLKQHAVDHQPTKQSLLDNVFTINWQALPLLHLCQSLEAVLSAPEWAHYLPRFGQLALRLPNVGLRNQVLNGLRTTAAQSQSGRACTSTRLFDRMTGVTTSYGAQIDQIVDIFKKLAKVNRTGCEKPNVGNKGFLDELNRLLSVCLPGFQIDQRTQAIAKAYFKDDDDDDDGSDGETPVSQCQPCDFQQVFKQVKHIIVRYFPELQHLAADQYFKFEVYKTLIVSEDWLLVDDKDMKDEMAWLGLCKTEYMATVWRSAVIVVILRLIPQVPWTDLFIVKLLNYELQLALYILMANVERVNDLHNVLDVCLDEIRSSDKEAHLIAIFLTVLNEVDTPTRNSFFRKIIGLIPEHPRWMPIVIHHNALWSLVPIASDFMFDALTYGEHCKGDQLIERRYLKELHKSPDDDVRIIALKRIGDAYKQSGDTMSLEPLRVRCVDFLHKLHATKPRYYANSATHRLKLRLVQAIAVMVDLDGHTTPGLIEMLLDENNQLNVTYIVELIVGRTHQPTDLIECLHRAETPNARRSMFMCMYYSCSNRQNRPFDATAHAHQYVQAMSVWTMGKDYHTRVMAQTTIRQILERFPDAKYETLLETIDSALRDEPRLVDHFRFNIVSAGDDSIQLTVLCDIPRITGMCALETIDATQWNVELDRPLHACPVMAKPKASHVRTELVELNVGNVQRKMVPLKVLFPDMKEDVDDQTASNVEQSAAGLVVVASLITRMANLGGLSRTCEIFGVEKFVVDSLRHRDHAEFQALSMTSEKWLRIAEVKPYHLVDYLLEMKRRGYTIVGAEQTSNGITIGQLVFPKKSVLLLGHEKEGIPGNLLSLLDYAVEIPQFGVVRSLNVHVTGALFIWEYAKQHNVFV